MSCILCHLITGTVDSSIQSRVSEEASSIFSFQCTFCTCEAQMCSIAGETSSNRNDRRGRSGGRGGHRGHYKHRDKFDNLPSGSVASLPILRMHSDKTTMDLSELLGIVGELRQKEVRGLSNSQVPRLSSSRV